MRCFSPNLDAASCISCPEGVCPGDLVCRDGHCVAPGADEDLCSASGGAGGGDAGNSGQGAQAGEAGAPEPDSGGAPGMEITVSSPEFLCTGREFELEASVSGGTEPYSWSATGFPEGTQTRTRDERVTVFLTPPAAGKPDVILRVTDATGLEVERTVNLEVRETPVVETETLPSVCPDEVYSAPLVASGGDEDGYTWETDLSEEETGLGVSGQRLAGHFITDEDEARKTQLELRVESNGCTSAPRTLTLEQNARFADVCPRIKVVSRFGGEPIAGNHGLPAACLGSDYRASLTAEDASPSSEFRDVSLPKGITFERNTATLGGVGEASGVVTVQVEDGETHRTIEQDFELELRERCWFAYLDSATGASRLNLIDAVLDNRRGFPADTAGDPVSDFEFSPDGRFLAYRTGADPASRRLTILELRTFLDAVLDYESVTRYAWSQHAEGSSILAVAYGTGDARYLGGVDVTRAERDDSSRTIRFPKLAPGSAAVDSPLTWYAGSHVGFLSLIQVVEEDEYFSLSLASLADARFLDARSDSNIYFSGTRLQSAEDGLFLVPSSATAQAVSYLPADGSTPVLHHDVLLSPSGRFVARSEAGELKVFRSTQSSDPEHEGEFATSARCDSLLAWSAGDRVACADFSEQASPRIVTFDVDYDAGAREYRISKASEVHGSYEYSDVPRNVRQRVFSPTGARFAFTTADALYVAEIGSDSSIQLTSPGADLPAMLVFSADGTRLLQHRGGTLALYSLEGVRDENPSPIATDLPEPSPCDEDFKAGAGNHCGEVRGQAAFSSSPDATQVAFRTSDGTLLLGDLRFEDLLSRIELTDACSAGCYAGERFAFQP